GLAALFAEIGVRPVLSSLNEITEWADFCQARGESLPAAIHIDTGMTRFGVPAEELRQLAQRPDLLACFDLRLIMSHLAWADEPAHAKNEAQRALFEELAALFPGVPRSLANSAGIFLGQRFHFDLTRPGVALYGGRPRAAGTNPMEPVLRLFGRITQMRWAG